jgi:hypothetical protein
MVESGLTFALRSPSASERLGSSSSPIRKVHPDAVRRVSGLDLSFVELERLPAVVSLQLKKNWYVNWYGL